MVNRADFSHGKRSFKLRSASLSGYSQIFYVMDTILENFSRTWKVYKEILSHILRSAVRDILFTKNAKGICENVNLNLNLMSEARV